MDDDIPGKLNVSGSVSMWPIVLVMQHMPRRGIYTNCVFLWR